jgi:hypothetical protein
VLGGLDVGEPPSARPQVMKAMLEKLPAEKPRMVIGPGAPGMKGRKKKEEKREEKRR